MSNTPENSIETKTWTDQEVIDLLDWLRKSRYHNGGFNGWNMYGHSPFYSVPTKNIIHDYRNTLNNS